MRVIAAAALLLLVTAGSAAATRWPDIWVAVHGPADGVPPEELVLEIGATAWLGYGGVVDVPSDVALPVRLVGRASCRIYARFVAPPGSAWVIRFAGDGSLTVEDWSGRGLEAGPGLPERLPSGCPQQAAATETATGEAEGAGVPAILAAYAGVVVLSVVAFALGARRGSAARREENESRRSHG